MRFRLRTLLIVMTVGLATTGCQSRAEPTTKPSSITPSAPRVQGELPATKAITSEQAVEIVRQMIKTASGGETVFDCDASETDEGYSVFVTFGTGRDANGKLIGMYPGGHTLYKLSKTGKVLKIIGGA